MNNITIYSLEADEALGYVAAINNNEHPHDVIDLATHEYVKFEIPRIKDTSFLWPSIGGKIFTSNSDKEYFREDKTTQKKILGDKGTIVLFPSILKIIKSDKEYPLLVPKGFIDACEYSSGLFAYYNPWLITYPMRIVIKDDDKNTTTNTFLADKIFHNTIKVDGLNHVEYIPSWFGKLTSSILDRCWETLNVE